MVVAQFAMKLRLQSIKLQLIHKVISKSSQAARLLRHYIFLCFFMLLIPFCSHAAVVEVDTELALLIDGSGSISSEGFDLQKQGYLNALDSLWNTTDVFQSSKIAIGVWQFSSRAGTDFIVEHEESVIDSLASFNSLMDNIANMNKIGLSTNIGDTIADAASVLLDETAIKSSNKIIDVSTDGRHNIGTDPFLTANAAILAGMNQVNCIGIGAAANCGFIAGVDSFALQANSFEDFQPLLLTKLKRELGITKVNAPGTIALFVLALIIFGCSRQRS